MFELRKEAEMRLHSEKMARELALKNLLQRQRAANGEADEKPALQPEGERP
ncbi:hypothetical protein SAMN04487981_107344 [Streptomyces sp. cf386]|uniref:hypothetical protein n=1 Tax=Streptomyces sp. cf386 TaxID=1761904 RepID=UPI00088D1B4C|nr:hypothetical protein [Streptomyces sp. cf386]SDN93994.1 hypothetical protein SAMN04487981_107344 [Streptomyces sp. cf386]